jgi:hypothetical protein
MQDVIQEATETYLGWCESQGIIPMQPSRSLSSVEEDGSVSLVCERGVLARYEVDSNGHFKMVHPIEEESVIAEPDERTTLIEAYLAELEEEFQTTDKEELWGSDSWETITSNRADALLEAYEEHIDAATDEELFGEDGLDEMVADRIEELIDVERERLDEMDDEELSEYLASGVNTKHARMQTNRTRTQEQLSRLDSMFRREKAELTCQKAAV